MQAQAEGSGPTGSRRRDASDGGGGEDQGPAKKPKMAQKPQKAARATQFGR